MILTALLMTTMITGIGISFSQFSDVNRSPWRGGGNYHSRGRVGSALAVGKGKLLGLSPGRAQIKETRTRPCTPIPPCLGPFPLCPHLLRPSTTPSPNPFVSFSDGCFQSQVVLSSAQNPEIKGRSQAGPEAWISLYPALYSPLSQGWLA